MEHHTLVLTPWMTPHRIACEQSAIYYVLGDKVDVLETWDEVVRSPSISFLLPSVARLRRPVATYKKGVKFSWINVLTRDDFTCQYCGKRKPMRELNRDHVKPIVQGGETKWENIVTSCYVCNDKKGGRTPEQAGMRLRRKPYIPKTLPMTTPFWPLDRVPEKWIPFLQGSTWGAALSATG